MTTMTLNWDCAGLPATSVLDIFVSNITATEALQEVKDQWQLSLRPVVVNTTSLVSIGYGGDAPIELSVGEPGTLSGQASPPNTCYLVDKNADSGRRGRWFLPGLAEDFTAANGTLNTTMQANVTTACNTFLDQLALAGVQLRIARADGTFSNISSFTCQSLVGVQRKRLGR